MLLHSQEVGCPEELVDACWEFVGQLRRGRQGLCHSREAVAEMVGAMLGWGSPALAFIRRVRHPPFPSRFCSAFSPVSLQISSLQAPTVPSCSSNAFFGRFQSDCSPFSCRFQAVRQAAACFVSSSYFLTYCYCFSTATRHMSFALAFKHVFGCGLRWL